MKQHQKIAMTDSTANDTIAGIAFVAPLPLRSSVPSLQFSKALTPNKAEKHPKTQSRRRLQPPALQTMSQQQPSEHAQATPASHSALDQLDSTTALQQNGFSDPFIRPRGDLNFAIPFNDNFVVRHWQHRDSYDCREIVFQGLREMGIKMESEGTDSEVCNVPEAFRHGEFWVVEDVSTGRVVGAGGFYPFKPIPGAMEIRKLFLRPEVCGQGIGSFLLCALEHRAAQLGFHIAIVETISTLKPANVIYERAGYTPSLEPIVVDRCDLILEKDISPSSLNGYPGNGNGHDHGHDMNTVYLEATDLLKGWRIASIPRHKIERHRLAFRAVVVLIQQRSTDAKVVVHKRSTRKKTYPGRMATLVTGCSDWGEDPVDTARREVFEEVGITNLEFIQPFSPFQSDDADKQRIFFYPFVATGDFDESDFVCDPNEVEFAKLMTREEIQSEGIGGRLWDEFRAHGL